MKIKITADSTCDLSEELLAQWDIALMPMHILMGEDSYLDGVTIYPADVFAYVNAGGKMPKSAAANLVEYTEFFEPFAKECDAVIHISVSSKLSSCFQNAKLAAGEFENVYVVDSQNICTGQGYLVLKAAKWAADGLLPRNITMRLQSLAKRVELSFVLDRLDFMAKSGRCSGVLAFGANILGIKPMILFKDGEIFSGGVARGRQKSFEKALDLLMTYLAEHNGTPDDYCITVGYGYDADEGKRLWMQTRAALRAKYPGAQCEVGLLQIGCTIAVHTGPYALGMGVMRRWKKQG